MRTSHEWVTYFKTNLTRERVNWELRPVITGEETAAILSSLQAWQLGETSDGKHLLHAATIYAGHINDPEYIEAVALFIKEEQKHGNNLGKYLDLIGKPRIKYNWGDSMFRKVRYFNTSMEIWTLAVIVVESAAQIFYQSMKDATGCALLQQICTDILIDEARHIDFQKERFDIIFRRKHLLTKAIAKQLYRLFFIFTTLLIWNSHKRVFRAGGNTFASFMKKMNYKYTRTLHRSMKMKHVKTGHHLMPVETTGI